MKKSVVVIVGVAVLAGVWLGGTWYTGKKLETESVARIDQLNEQLAKINPQAELVLSQVSFERGFFKSQARYALVGGEKGKEPNKRIEFVTEYEHGPFPAGALAQGRFLPTLAVAHSALAKTQDSELLFEAAQGKAPLTSDVLLSYSGNAQFDVQFAPLSVQDEEDAFSFSGAQLVGDFKAENQHAVGTFLAPTLTMDIETENGDRLAMTLSDAQMDFDMYQNEFGVQSGDAELQVERLSLYPENKSEVVIEKLVYGGKSTEDDTMMKGEAYLSTGSLTVDGQSFGSQSAVFKMDKLDGKALKLVSDAYNQVAANLSTPEGPDEDKLTALVQAGTTLLQGNPTLALDDFSWTTEKGRSTLAMHSEWQAPTKFNVPESALLAQAVKAVRIDLALNKPMTADVLSKVLQISEDMDAQTAEANATQQVDQGLASLSSLDVFEEDGETFKSHIEFDGSKITINGKDAPPELLLGLMLAM